MAEITVWQVRLLTPMYPVAFFDTLRAKIRKDAVVRNKAIYLALGVPPEGSRGSAVGILVWVGEFHQAVIK